jgi:hypothetical protein
MYGPGAIGCALLPFPTKVNLYFTLPLVSYRTLIGLLGLRSDSSDSPKTEEISTKKERKNNSESELSPSSDFLKLLMPWRNLI